MLYLKPDWPAPKQIKAFTTTRQQGASCGNFASFNLATHVGDQLAAVRQNRQQLFQDLALPAEPQWLNQIHSNCALSLMAIPSLSLPNADASFATCANQVCVVMTADCLPILLCNQQGTAAAAIHAGWRGLATGIIENTLNFFDRFDDILAWFGPAISQAAFEVGDEVRACFVTQDAKASLAFKPSYSKDKWLANLYLLAKQRLITNGVQQIFGGNRCTFSEPEYFYSWRRDQQTGRMATLIWFENY